MSRGMLLSIRDLCISIPDRSLFSSFSLSLSRGEVVSLIGPNGSGKTTLLRHIAIQSNKGGVTISPNDTAFYGNVSVTGQITIDNAAELAALDQKVTVDMINAVMANSISSGGPYKMLGAFGLPAQVEDLSVLSDGMLQKLALALLFDRRADLYLLDEPSNYLDLNGIVALESHIEQLKNAGAGFLMVTHDRELSDRLSDNTVYLAPEGIYQSAGGASAALDLKESDIISRTHQTKVLQRKISQLEEDFRAKAGWAQQKEKTKRGGGAAKGYISHMSAKLARRAKAVQMRIDRKQDELRQAKPFVPKTIKLSFPQRVVPKRVVFRLVECSFRYPTSRADPQVTDSPLVLQDVSIGASTSDRLCLMGGNGAGKSTLLRLAMGELKPTTGEVYLNSNVSTCVIRQGLSGYFVRDRLLDNFEFADISSSVIRQYLGAALIRREMVLQRISELSQGELARAALVHAILGKADFLVMDEPTSHLDLESVIVLERILSSFTGGFFIVSHDRAFVSHVANQLFYLENTRLRLA